MAMAEIKLQDATPMTALELSTKMKAGEVSVEEVVKKQLEIIKSEDEKYNCYITVWEEAAIARAKEVQKLIDEGKLADSSLAGVPIAIKDNICTKGELTTCASKMLSNFKPPYNAEVIERLEAAGAIIIGKANMDEFAMGSTTETSYYGPTKNPRGVEYVPGGSSGGAAAAVAAREAVIALGSDTGGSVRQPCSFCGVTGIKPTYGTVSRYGLIAYASSLDQIGPIANNVADCASVLEVIAGHDAKDSTSVPTQSYQYTKALVDDVKGKKIGIPRGYIGKGEMKK